MVDKKQISFHGRGRNKKTGNEKYAYLSSSAAAAAAAVRPFFQESEALCDKVGQ
jgi:hypothetical protein